MTLYAVMLFAHVIAVVIWVGGMFSIHFAVRPAAVALLEPPQRLPLVADVLRRFFAWVAATVLVAIASGVVMMVAAGGVRGAHTSVHLMLATGIAMSAIFLYVRLLPYRRLVAAVAAGDWPAAARALASVRAWVAANLALGVVTIAVATLGRLTL